MLNVPLELHQQVRGPDGTILWSGGGVIGQDFQGTVATGGTTIVAGDAVQFDSTNSVIPRPEITAAGATPAADLPQSLAIFVNQSPAVADSPNLIGVAQKTIPAGRQGSIAGSGSLVCVKSTAVLIAVGKFVSSSATAGAVAIAGVPGAQLNNILGAVFKINQVASPGTGSTTFAGILVKGGSAAIS